MQACIGRQRPILGKPLGERPGADAESEAFLDVYSDMPARLPTVVTHKGIKDDSQGEGFALGDLWSEAPIALMTAPELDSLEFFVAPAFPGEVCAPAVQAALALLADERTAGTHRGGMGGWRKRSHTEEMSATVGYLLCSMGWRIGQAVGLCSLDFVMGQKHLTDRASGLGVQPAGSCRHSTSQMLYGSVLFWCCVVRLS
jgi:hypothetical protein